MKKEIRRETCGDWVKRLGQWHLYLFERPHTISRTICGKPMLGNNYARDISQKDRIKCETCFKSLCE